MQLTNITALDAAGGRTDAQISEQQVRRAVFDILQSNVLCSVATVDPNGRAHINTAYFCYSDELELYFLSHPRSTHCQNLSTNPATAMAIFSASQRWGGPDAGVQLFGRCGEVQSAESNRAEELYANRFSAYADWKRTRSGSLGAEYRFYRFVVLRLKVIHEAQFGDGVLVSATILRK